MWGIQSSVKLPKKNVSEASIPHHTIFLAACFEDKIDQPTNWLLF